MNPPDASSSPNPSPWEDAYRRFETPEQEIRKFLGRLERAGAGNWPKEARIVELFCGRGNGLHALEQLGFTSLEGVDLSPTLAAEYKGPGKITVADCRKLPFPNSSRDILLVQGGLHHLPTLPADLESTLGEVVRVLRPGGLFLAVEPWLTPFLRLVHALCRQRLVRRLSPKFDALATMIQHEEGTYFQWLNQPQPLLDVLRQRFQTEQLLVRFGKIHFLGRKP
jgi:SAM-dependent methyltransferase